ncbi:MAG: phage holin family protein [Actinobacteria bacterium]|nr:phage holin family protein [Actinomycetota bacterium]
MIRFLVRTVILLLAVAIGLLAATVMLSGFSISFTSFIWVVVIFTVVQAVLEPFLVKTSRKNAPALLGGIGLVTAFVALFVTNIFASGLSISGASTWIFAALIIWIVTMLATLFLPFLLVRMGIESARERNNSGPQ